MWPVGRGEGGGPGQRGYLLTGIPNSSATFAIYLRTFLHL